MRGCGSPTWKVFLEGFFWSCDTRKEAEKWATQAEALSWLIQLITCRRRTPGQPQKQRDRRQRVGQRQDHEQAQADHL